MPLPNLLSQSIRFGLVPICLCTLLLAGCGGDGSGGGGGPSISPAIATGAFHTCALLTTGAVRCWGFESFGQLGHDATADIGDGVGDSITVAGDVPVQ